MMKSTKDNILKGKRVLFFSPAFFGYENEIKSKLEELGAFVDMYDERSVKKNWQKALLKISPDIFKRMTENYYQNLLKKIRNNHYDYILFIKCEMATENILIKFRKTFREAKMCLYLWDSIKNVPNIKKKFKYFDYISSFDRYDCIKEPILNFRPLFFADEFNFRNKEDLKKCDYKYDLCFIGTIHSDRYKILLNIMKQAKKHNLKVFVYPYLQSKFIYYFYKIVKKEFKSTKITDFRFEKLSNKEIADIVRLSKAVIDIQHPKQTGLTMRTIEMVGMNKKVLTTNEDITNYDFYAPSNIQTINRDSVCLDRQIFSDSYELIFEDIYMKYSLKNWILDVLGVEK